MRSSVTSRHASVTHVKHQSISTGRDTARTTLWRTGVSGLYPFFLFFPQKNSKYKKERFILNRIPNRKRTVSCSFLYCSPKRMLFGLTLFFPPSGEWPLGGKIPQRYWKSSIQVLKYININVCATLQYKAGLPFVSLHLHKQASK